MFEWITAHEKTINTLVNLGMLIVWISYLHVFISSYRRQNRANILINRGAGAGLNGRCLVSNMSADAIYVESIVATLETIDGDMTCPITELIGQEEKNVLPDLKLDTRQGPLLAGHVRDIGTFHSLIAHVLQHEDSHRNAIEHFIQQSLRAVQITVVAVYGSEDLLVGARRRFEIVRTGGDLGLKACTVSAEQIRSRRERKAINTLLEKDL